MRTVFTLNPIKVNIISIRNAIKKTIIFIGVVPKDVRNELTKIESSGKHNSNNIILNKFYGKHWDVKLGLKKSLINKTGGDEFSFDDNQVDLDEIQVDNMISEIAEDVDTESEVAQLKNRIKPANISETRKQLHEQIQSVQDNIITLDELEEIDDVDEAPLPSIDLSISKEKRVSQITETEGAVKIKFIFADPYISIYPEDKILEFKKKLYTVLEIPIFRQHIWYVYQGRTYPLNYSVFDNDSLLYINIQGMLIKYNDVTNPPQLIENIPVNTRYYQKKAYLKVVTNDTFSILDEFYHNYGVTEYNLLDLDDFVNPSRKILTEVINDSYQLELIYYSFIIVCYYTFYNTYQ